jgi:hypothetical protein
LVDIRKMRRSTTASFSERGYILVAVKADIGRFQD